MKKGAIILALLFGLILCGGISAANAGDVLPPLPVPLSLPLELTAFEGDWAGVIQIPEGGKMDLRLKIAGNEVQQFYKDKESFWQPLNLSKFQFNCKKENAVFFWIGAGRIRTETNIFALTLKDDRTIEVGFTRQINNLRSFGGNETKKIEGIGKLWRIG